ncbi:NAD(P)-binding protein [Aspergillus steynii IBT 23096]|uniref:NAD(P)-binding protein n=1 Tax=Aspergillus steynii IBT 23096 TaxID=1392250 RepID=A0A2I2G3W5_9EURO|nr:NAD(P)-binding protein [Aspergillus steynii IBT 23096]PLB47567.1 NAD(P)-binding protein [Aspergillus steynii IBT 23096]
MKVLIFGGNGRIARAVTRLMLARGWDVTSVIRNAKQKPGILQLGTGHAGQVDVVQCDLSDLKSSKDAAKVLENVRPTCVAFAAGSFSLPYEIDRDAAQMIIKASTDAEYVRKFLIISFPASRRHPAPWWDRQDVRHYVSERTSYPDIGDSKLQADEYLVAMAKARNDRSASTFQAISLRPSWLLTSPATGKVHLGKTRSLGQVTIGDVAAVAVSLLARDDTSGWFDLLQGMDEVDEAIDRVVREGIDCIEGEDLEAIYKVAG